MFVLVMVQRRVGMGWRDRGKVTWDDAAKEGPSKSEHANYEQKIYITLALAT